MSIFPEQFTNHMGTVKIRRRLLLLGFKKEIKEPEVIKLLAEQPGVNLFRAYLNEFISIGLGPSKINNTVLHYWVTYPAGANTDFDLFIKKLRTEISENLDWVGPVYSDPRVDGLKGFFCPLPDRLMIRSKPGQEDKQIELARNFGLEFNELRSKYLTNFLFFDLPEAKEKNIYKIREELLQYKDLVEYIALDNLPLIDPTAADPGDPLFSSQWNMHLIEASLAWNLTTGSNAVTIGIIDDGCDVNHLDLSANFLGPNVNLYELSTGSSVGPSLASIHGTNCAGIIAAVFNNQRGIAGLAGNCKMRSYGAIGPLDSEIAIGINLAIADNVDVINLSQGWGWDFNVIDPAIINAHNAQIVICAATQNYNAQYIAYPAIHPLVMSCGATDENDERWQAIIGSSSYGSNYGNFDYPNNYGNYLGVRTGVSVVAPGAFLPTTDLSGTGGNNTSPGVVGDYVMAWWGTSAATPHVSGLAALIKSRYPSLTQIEIRNIIERTAAKVGSYMYTEDADFPNGSRHIEMGHGRINAFHALDLADVMIRDWPGDNGTEPSNPPNGNYWATSDIVVRPDDDDFFDPSDYLASANVEKGQTNYIYVRVVNKGPNVGRNVRVNVRVVAYAGSNFQYPYDWVTTDSSHIQPTSILDQVSSMDAGDELIFKFSLSSAQVDELYGWEKVNFWHPCILAEVVSDNDYPFINENNDGTNILVRKNNFAQKNLSVVDAISDSNIFRTFPMIIGNKKFSKSALSLIIERRESSIDIPIYLLLEQNEPLLSHLNFEALNRKEAKIDETIQFLKDTEVIINVGSRKAIAKFKKGSFFEYMPINQPIQVKQVKGGKITYDGEQQIIQLQSARVQIDMSIASNTLYPVAFRTNFKRTRPNDKVHFSIWTQDENGIVYGGVDIIYLVH